MDPTECLAEILLALREDRKGDAIQGMENLAGWLQRGGFSPDVDDALKRQLMRYHCDN
jgi:hypothetical protein